MNKQQLASKIWESANKMRSKIEANEYKDYILGFIFYKFLSDQELKFLKEKDWTEEYLPQLTEADGESVEWVQDNLGYFIAYENLFSTWIDLGSDFNANMVTDALNAFGRLINKSHRKVFDGIFATLQTGLSKLGESSGARTKAIRELIYLIKDIPMDGKQDYDVLGFIYEYLISNFAANAGKKAGEFYTPHEVSLLMSEIIANHLKDREKIDIYDPTSGSGSLLINIGKCVSQYMDKENAIGYYAQELKENTYNLTRMNLVMRGIIPSNITTRNGDTLEDDWPFFEENDPTGTYHPLYLDAVVSNPPYSQAWDPTDKATDPRYARFGLAPKGKADYAFLLHDLYHLKPDGIMTIVLPHGVLFRGGEEGIIRKNLIESNHIDAVIGLPPNIFFGTGIPTIVMVLRQKRDNSDVLIVDASKGFEKVGKNNLLRACDIKKIVDAVTTRSDVEKFSRKVSREEVRANDYNLNIPRYVDSSEKAESWDIYASMLGGIPNTELDGFARYWEAFPGLREALFTAKNEAYSDVKVSDLKAALQDHAAVQAFRSRYETAFASLPEMLAGEWVAAMETVNLAREESRVSADLFNRFDALPLVDPYAAYQVLHDHWQTVSGDLEIIQSEGRSAVTAVDPNLVMKKKQGKDVEVQDGWKGHILPFDLVASSLLADDLDAIQAKDEALLATTAALEACFDELSEDDKEKEFVNGEKGTFVLKEVTRALKLKLEEPEVLKLLTRVKTLLTRESDLKKQLKHDLAALHLKTKETIEALTPEQAADLLKAKWIEPLMASLLELPGTVLTAFASDLDKLAAKYATTFETVEQAIQRTEASLVDLLDDLQGNAFDLQGLAELKTLFAGR